MLDELFAIIEDRKANPVEGSYTASLFAAGENRICQKVGEEAVEVIIAAKGEGKERLIAEIADLYYHSLVLLSSQGLSWSDVEEELRKRHQK